MYKFLEKRERVCLCVGGGIPLPNRTEHMEKRVSNEKGFREVRGVLPNGETFYYIAKFSGISLYATYIDGKMEGIFRVRSRQKGKLLIDGHFKDGRPHGLFRQWEPEAQRVLATCTFVKGRALEWNSQGESYIISRNEKKKTLFVTRKEEDDGGLLVSSWFFSGMEPGEINQKNIGSAFHVALQKEKYRKVEIFATKFFADERETTKTQQRPGGLFSDFLWAEVPTSHEERCP